MRSYILYIGVVLLVGHAGCMRYVPARSELGNNSARSSLSEHSMVAGEEEFVAFERNQQKRLERLLKERGALLAAGTATEYLIGPGDLVKLSVFDIPELNTDVRVRPSGMIFLPLIGKVKAAGLTESKLQKKIARLLRSYVRDPQVQLSISAYGAHVVSVIGEVARPGVYPLKRNKYSLLELLSQAGGRTERASSRIVLIPARERTGNARSASASAHRGGEENYGIEIDMDDLQGNLSKPPLVVPLVSGDTIVVPEQGTVEVAGEVRKPGSYSLSARTSILGALAAAGGLTYSANVHEVELIRDIGAGRKAARSFDVEKLALKGGEDLLLHDGDMVRVPSQPGRFATRQMVEVLNGVFGGGVSGTVDPVSCSSPSGGCR